MNNRESNQSIQKQNRRRSQIIRSVLAGILLLTLVLAILSFPPIREQFMSEWLKTRWEAVLAVAVIFGIGIIGVLPVVIEANFNPRVLRLPVRGESRDKSVGLRFPRE